MYSSYVNAIANLGEVVAASPGSTSYFSEPDNDLDPTLFLHGELKGTVRNAILEILFSYLATNFAEPHRWVHAWLAGSGVSYQWSASRNPGDLDCLVGIEYVRFRELNPEYAGLGNQEIAQMFNEAFSAELMPKTRNWHGYELTYYVNPATDIRDINPYAAYDLINDAWTVEPSRSENPPYSRAWEQRAHRDYQTGVEMVNRYSQALNEVRSATNPAHRVNAEAKLKLAVEQAVVFYEDIHAGRKVAFSPTGAGYSDFNNYRWQAGKRTGIVQALRKIKDYHDAATQSSELDTYGVELPSAATLVRRTAARRIE